MGLREAVGLFGIKALATDCMICHGGSIFGKSYVGLGNTALDIESFFLDMAEADGRPRKLPFCFSATSAAPPRQAACRSFCSACRQPDLKLRTSPLELGLRDDMIEDTPAWWLLKKKKTMYHTGGGDARSVRSLMQFMMSPLNSADSIKREEETFRDIQAYLLSLEPPKYPLPIDSELARTGAATVCEELHASATAPTARTGPIRTRSCRLKEIGTDAKPLSRHLGVVWPVLQPVLVWPGAARLVCRRLPGSTEASATRPRRWTASGRLPRTSTTARCRRSMTC